MDGWSFKGLVCNRGTNLKTEELKNMFLPKKKINCRKSIWVYIVLKVAEDFNRVENSFYLYFILQSLFNSYLLFTP